MTPSSISAYFLYLCVHPCHTTNLALQPKKFEEGNSKINNLLCMEWYSSGVSNLFINRANIADKKKETKKERKKESVVLEQMTKLNLNLTKC
jgi:hypothetical protein